MYQQLLSHIKEHGWSIPKATTVIEPKKGGKKKRKRRVKMIVVSIKERRRQILEKQIHTLEQNIAKYTTKNDNSKRMKQELRRLKKNLIKELEAMDKGIPLSTEERRPFTRIR